MGDIFLQQHNRIEREREREGEKKRINSVHSIACRRRGNEHDLGGILLGNLGILEIQLNFVLYTCHIWRPLSVIFIYIVLFLLLF